MKIDGKKVRDAREPLFFYVDLQDVKAANRKDPASCAAAVAIQRQCGCKRALVYRTSVLIEYPKEWVRYRAPVDMGAQIKRFDRTGDFESCVYRLQTPNYKLGARKRKPGKHGNHKTKRKAYTAVIRDKSLRRAAPRGRSVGAAA